MFHLCLSLSQFQEAKLIKIDEIKFPITSDHFVEFYQNRRNSRKSTKKFYFQPQILSHSFTLICLQKTMRFYFPLIKNNRHDFVIDELNEVPRHGLRNFTGRQTNPSIQMPWTETVRIESPFSDHFSENYIQPTDDFISDGRTFTFRKGIGVRESRHML